MALGKHELKEKRESSRHFLIRPAVWRNTFYEARWEVNDDVSTKKRPDKNNPKHKLSRSNHPDDQGLSGIQKRSK
ncbi:hypothetical protein DNH61_06520 [Paenibacillus sambharensis]|uniref:Uncharacterized protein n=1 Tax=Paenibacillus sambharensis TaxID=1803190 RepID=A0A2W1LZA7_9BACL|nr:hypothetical protein DNH61_06520 [Paenibacillus sambharensis]